MADDQRGLENKINHLSRRNFLKTIGAGSLAAAPLVKQAKASTDDIDPPDDTGPTGGLDLRVDKIPEKEGMDCFPVKINDDGKVIGYYLAPDGNTTHFVYKDGIVRDLNLKVPDGFYPAYINGLSDMVFEKKDTTSLLYKFGKKEPIRLRFCASGINERDVVGHKEGLSYKYNIKTEEPTELGEFEAAAIDKQGRIAGNIGDTAIVWEDGEIRELERHPNGAGYYRTYAREISNGIVIGDIEHSPDEYAPCMWDKDGKVTELPITSTAAINNGMILGSSKLHIPYNGETADLWEVQQGFAGIDINKKGQMIGTLEESLEEESKTQGIILTIGNKDYIPPDTASLKAILTVTNQDEQDGRNHYDYDLVIEESNGVGVDITRGRSCFDSIGCEDWVDFSPPRRVPPNGEYTRSSWWWTGSISDAHWLEYKGTDDNGNSVSVVSNKLVHPS